MAYFLSLLLIARGKFSYLLTHNISLTLSLIACIYSLFAIMVLMRSRSIFKWLFFVSNILIFLIHLYGIYYDIAAYNA